MSVMATESTKESAMANIFKIQRNVESDEAWDLIERFNAGEFTTEDLHCIAFYTNKMAKAMEKRDAEQFKVGQRAQITAKNVSPKYLQGATGMIKAVAKNGAVTIALDEAYGNKVKGEWVGYPNSCYTLLSA